MSEILKTYLPNVLSLLPLLKQATKETLIMVFFSGIYASVVGIPLGVLLFSLGKGNILENKFFHSILSKIINILRSIPFIILISAIPGIIKILAGSTIGVKGAIVSLSIGCFPFIARQVELSLLQVDKGVIEAYESMGFTSFQIIRKIILKEAMPYIIQAITVSFVSLVSFSAVAGSVGGGGLGSFAIQYGYNEFKNDIMLVTVVIILLIVMLIQFIGDTIYKKLRH
ncbi:putative D-methionine transport system permease protein MetI [Tissierellia bacterium KA00581]|jgi:hypothetical protein|nr:putative D-methionine transport system permease protein MetI [Tissierellia bacterium KA00581]